MRTCSNVHSLRFVVFVFVFVFFFTDRLLVADNNGGAGRRTVAYPKRSFASPRRIPGRLSRGEAFGGREFVCFA
jgi:hypothetical protein